VAGSLVVVGTGIQALSHLTLQAQANIRQADIVFYCMSDPIIEHHLKELNPRRQDLFPLYGMGKERMTTYEEMVEAILAPVRDGLRVCAAFYGHPGVFAYPPHEAIRRARDEGYSAEMLPAISAEDCLFADLGVDPGIPGCQSFEATEFLVVHRKFDPGSSLVLWQIGVIGLVTWWEETYDPHPGLKVLTDELLRTYPPEHVVVVYEAAHLPVGEPRRDPVELRDLAGTPVKAISTLYVPPREASQLDDAMLAQLGMARESIPVVEGRVVLNRPTSPPHRALTGS
jgi:precorrin-6B methylase 1